MKLITTILLISISFLVKCQEADTLIYYNPETIDSLTNVIDSLENVAVYSDSCQTVIDSLNNVIELKALEFSAMVESLSLSSDTTNISTVYDSLYIYVDKQDRDIRVTISDLQSGIRMNTWFIENVGTVWMCHDTICNQKWTADSTGISYDYKWPEGF